MKNKQLSIAVLAAVVVAAVFYFTVSDNAPRNTGGAHVTIAVNAPLTGPIAAWSGQFGNGFRMGLEDALRAQQIDPKEFSLDIQDNSGKPEQAVSIFRKQELSGFDVYVTAAAGPVNAVAPLVDATHKPQFLASFDPFITAVAPDRLRVMANSRLDAPLLVSYARTHGAKHVHIIYLNYPNLQEAYASILEPQLKQAGATVTREVFEMDVRDFRSIAEKAKAQAPDLVFVMGFSFHLQALIRDLRVAELVRPGHLGESRLRGSHLLRNAAGGTEGRGLRGTGLRRTGEGCHGVRMEEAVRGAIRREAYVCTGVRVRQRNAHRKCIQEVRHSDSQVSRGCDSLQWRQRRGCARSEPRHRRHGRACQGERLGPDR